MCQQAIRLKPLADARKSPEEEGIRSRSRINLPSGVHKSLWLTSILHVARLLARATCRISCAGTSLSTQGHSANGQCVRGSIFIHVAQGSLDGLHGDLTQLIGADGVTSKNAPAVLHRKAFEARNGGVVILERVDDLAVEPPRSLMSPLPRGLRVADQREGDVGNTHASMQIRVIS